MPQRIEIDGITKTFKGFGGGLVTAVDNVRLTIEPGELFFLLGPSGCGKTTLLRMIAGFIDPNGGSIRFDERDMTNVAANKRNAGMVFQSYALWPHLTVYENVAFGLKLRRVAGADRDRRVEAALEAVQMGQYADRRPGQLSGGQQQRVALARALVIEPGVLLLDEPLSNLDAKLRNDLRLEIRRICKSAGITSIYVTHDQKEALSMADRIAIMRDGRVEQVGTPVDLYQRPATAFVAEFLGETNLLRGRVSVNGSGPLFAFDGGEFGLPADAEARAGETVCSIRPESWIVRSDPADGALPGTIDHVTYLGEVVQTVVAVGAHRIKTLELGGAGASGRGAGDRVYLGVKPGGVSVVHG